MKVLRVAALLGLLSCSATGLIDGPMAAVTVFGTVSLPNGTPAAGVSVIAEARAQASCATGSLDRDSVMTNAAGRYRATLLNWGNQFSVCVALRVVPPEGMAFATDSAQRVPVLMRSSNPDSLRVDIVLRPSPPGSQLMAQIPVSALDRVRLH